MKEKSNIQKSYIVADKNKIKKCIDVMKSEFRSKLIPAEGKLLKLA